MGWLCWSLSRRMMVAITLACCSNVLFTAQVDTPLRTFYCHLQVTQMMKNERKRKKALPPPPPKPPSCGCTGKNFLCAYCCSLLQFMLFHPWPQLAHNFVTRPDDIGRKNGGRFLLTTSTAWINASAAGTVLARLYSYMHNIIVAQAVWWSCSVAQPVLCHKLWHS